jgi:phosphoserine aminotransferase
MICDASSAAFAMHLPWDKLDAVTWSWQKALGGEGAHGMLALSPRAVERLKTHQPAWPIPKLLRLAEGGRFREGIFRGESINTPSQLCVEDALDALRWAKNWRTIVLTRTNRSQLFHVGRMGRANALDHLSCKG